MASSSPRSKNVLRTVLVVFGLGMLAVVGLGAAVFRRYPLFGQGFAHGIAWGFSVERTSLQLAGCLVPLHLPRYSRAALEAEGATNFESCAPDGFCGVEKVMCQATVFRRSLTCDELARIHRKHGTAPEGVVFVTSVNAPGSLTKFRCRNAYRGPSGPSVLDLEATTDLPSSEGK